jgi:hypothetical protein
MAGAASNGSYVRDRHEVPIKSGLEFTLNRLLWLGQSTFETSLARPVRFSTEGLALRVLRHGK